MLIVTGTILVLLTWAALVVSLMSLGLLPALALQAHRPIRRAQVLRQAMWWGLGLSALFVLIAGLILPLGSPVTAAAWIAVLLALGIPGWIVLLRRSATCDRWPRSMPFLLITVAMVVSTIYLAAAALGPVTNYDSGLYHLGAISYARDFAAIPGLANLYSPLGYATVEFPWAAALGNGPWDAEGYRLLNGLVMIMATVDLLLRMRSCRSGPERQVLAVGILAAWIPMLALVDYWVTSPTQDSSTFVLSVVAAAYLVDAVASPRARVPEAATLGVLVITLVLIRPTMAAFALVALVVVVVVVARDRVTHHPAHAGRAVGLVIGFGALAAAASAARDYLLSGWLQYPLSLYAFDVPWRAAEPSMDRQATLGFHRDPDRLWESVEGWNWVGAWWTTRWSQWETYEWIGLALVAVALIVISFGLRVSLRWRRLALAMLPSVAAVAFWWAFTPPSYRFAWGPLFTVVAIPIGWTLWRMSRGTEEGKRRRRVVTLTAAAVSIPIIVVVAYSAAARMPWSEFTMERDWKAGVSIPYAIAPVVDVPVVEIPTTSGLTLLQPTESDQCWTNYPLCTPRAYPGLRLQGDDLQSGFLP